MDSLGLNNNLGEFDPMSAHLTTSHNLNSNNNNINNTSHNNHHTPHIRLPSSTKTNPSEPRRSTRFRTPVYHSVVDAVPLTLPRSMTKINADGDFFQAPPTPPPTSTRKKKSKTKTPKSSRASTSSHSHHKVRSSSGTTLAPTRERSTRQRTPFMDPLGSFTEFSSTIPTSSLLESPPSQALISPPSSPQLKSQSQSPPHTFQIQSIVGRRFCLAERRFHYRVRWYGFGENDDTWELDSSFPDSPKPYQIFEYLYHLDGNVPTPKSIRDHTSKKKKLLGLNKNPSFLWVIDLIEGTIDDEIAGLRGKRPKDLLAIWSLSDIEDYNTKGITPYDRLPVKPTTKRDGIITNQHLPTEIPLDFSDIQQDTLQYQYPSEQQRIILESMGLGHNIYDNSNLFPSTIASLPTDPGLFSTDFAPHGAESSPLQSTATITHSTTPTTSINTHSTSNSTLNTATTSSFDGIAPPAKEFAPGMGIFSSAISAMSTLTNLYQGNNSQQYQNQHGSQYQTQQHSSQSHQQQQQQQLLANHTPTTSAVPTTLLGMLSEGRTGNIAATSSLGGNNIVINSTALGPSNVQMLLSAPNNTFQALSALQALPPIASGELDGQSSTNRTFSPGSYSQKDVVTTSQTQTTPPILSKSNSFSISLSKSNSISTTPSNDLYNPNPTSLGTIASLPVGNGLVDGVITGTNGLIGGITHNGMHFDKHHQHPLGSVIPHSHHNNHNNSLINQQGNGILGHSSNNLNATNTIPSFSTHSMLSTPHTGLDATTTPTTTSTHSTLSSQQQQQQHKQQQQQQPVSINNNTFSTHCDVDNNPLPATKPPTPTNQGSRGSIVSRTTGDIALLFEKNITEHFQKRPQSSTNYPLIPSTRSNNSHHSALNSCVDSPLVSPTLLPRNNSSNATSPHEPNHHNNTNSVISPLLRPMAPPLFDQNITSAMESINAMKSPLKTSNLTPSSTLLGPRTTPQSIPSIAPLNTLDQIDQMSDEVGDVLKDVAVAVLQSVLKKSVSLQNNTMMRSPIKSSSSTSSTQILQFALNSLTGKDNNQSHSDLTHSAVKKHLGIIDIGNNDDHTDDEKDNYHNNLSSLLLQSSQTLLDPLVSLGPPSILSIDAILPDDIIKKQPNGSLQLLLLHTKGMGEEHDDELLHAMDDLQAATKGTTIGTKRKLPNAFLHDVDNDIGMLSNHHQQARQRRDRLLFSLNDISSSSLTSSSISSLPISSSSSSLVASELPNSRSNSKRHGSLDGLETMGLVNNNEQNAIVSRNLMTLNTLPQPQPLVDNSNNTAPLDTNSKTQQEQQQQQHRESFENPLDPNNRSFNHDDIDTGALHGVKGPQYNNLAFNL